MATKAAFRTVLLRKCVLSFPKLFKAEAYADGDKPRYSTTLLFEPAGDAAKALQTAIDEVIAEQWGKPPKGLQSCLKEGDEKVASARNPENYSMYAGQLYVTASTSQDTPPVIVDSDGRTPLLASSGKIYGGAIVDALVRVWGQDNKWGLRVNCELKAVQYRAKGTPFGGGGPIDPSKLFDDITEEDDWAA